MKLTHFLAGTVLVLAGGVAAAGRYSPIPVTIDFTGRFASGDMHSARTSSNPAEFIGCGIRDFGSTSLAFCQAGLGEAEGQYLTCFTEDPALVDAVKSIADFSYIQFRWDEDFNCTSIGISTQSFYLPDFKAKK
jgi:hypothetical protein